METVYFTRTTGGLTAQSYFYGSEYMVYIEGKDKESKGTTYDEKYYNAILSYLLPGKKVTIKVVGSCHDVLHIYRQILNSNISNTICFIERDYSGVTFNHISDYRLIRTYGYSWENDFWSTELCYFMINSLTNHNPNALNEFATKLKFGVSRLAFLHKINVACTFLNFNILALGCKGQDGIIYDSESLFLVSNSEIKRIVLPLKKHPEIKELRFFYKQIEALPERLIQGHYFEYIMLRAIKDVSKKYSPEKIAASEKIIKIISFSQFMIRPSNFLPPAVLDYYQEKLNLFLER
ncbi:DUF4435 domain-containing protein [Klebsiella quasipneumoniae]|uniref:DUF4435 domain-containing protein n=2 Tax=Klebsiella quasipneumoniae TaxID=1463165 RepID=UPI001FF5E0C4|nr:DUF4435 domain-containing protein [Klebsiella quasipneumoniae]MCJ8558731.1 DUF4435 domain-containing protein [Klebsiella quasipneumoniae]